MTAAGGAEQRVYLGIGGNLGDRIAALRHGLARLAEAGVAVEAVSSLYETEPWGSPACLAPAPPYANAAACVRSALSPLELLRLCKRIEVAAGRDLDAPRIQPAPAGPRSAARRRSAHRERGAAAPAPAHARASLRARATRGDRAAGRAPAAGTQRGRVARRSRPRGRRTARASGLGVRLALEQPFPQAARSAWSRRRRGRAARRWSRSARRRRAAAPSSCRAWSRAWRA